MKKELRGRKIKDYYIDHVTDLGMHINFSNYDEMSDEEIGNLNQEYGCDISVISNVKDIIDIIRESILKMYNDDITPTVMLLYCFLTWYRNAAKRLDRFEERERLLDFESVLDDCAKGNIGPLLSQKYDKENIDEYIMHTKYKLISMVNTRIIASDKSDCLGKLEHNLYATIHNCRFLHLIDDDNKVDNYYLMQWEYYPVDKLYRDIIESYNSEISKQVYTELNGKEWLYFEKIKKAEVDYSSIKSLDIVKDGKKRKVYLANKAIDKITLIYLSKRLNNEFHIAYPNRDKIMELSFNLIDSLPRLDNYTIFKFDFKNFFDSVEIKSVYDKYLEHSNLYSYEKELILKLAKKYKYCVQGLPTSNALIEIISKDFDDRVKSAFSEYGLVFYKRYVDDCILILNSRMKKDVISKVIDKCRVSTFGKKVMLSPSKTSYQTKLDGDDSFDYLGYSFARRYWDKGNKSYYYFEFGIATSKIEKYKKQLDEMFDAYEKDMNERLLLRRIQYYNSRIVFYNYEGSKYINKCTWEVRGIINSYRMLRSYVICDSQKIKGKKVEKKEPYRIQKDTYKFLEYYVKEKRDSLLIISGSEPTQYAFEHHLFAR